MLIMLIKKKKNHQSLQRSVKQKYLFSLKILVSNVYVSLPVLVMLAFTSVSSINVSKLVLAMLTLVLLMLI